jgi:type IV secretion system protein VirB10
MTDPVTAEPDASALPAKADPETLVLRGRPGRVVRFKRGVIVALTAVSMSGIVVAAWLALKPRPSEQVAPQDDSAEPARAPANALRVLPLSYADAPQLGPPLPGDLGQPILEHRRSPGPGETDATGARREAERERRANDRRKARQSGVLVQTSARRGVALASSNGHAAPAAVPSTAEPALSQAQVDPHRILAPASPYLLSAGSVIAASLMTGLRSDLPGLVIAQVTERVYDSPTGRLLLIPQGARLVGSYDSRVAFGQRRARIVWQRIVFPDGRSLHLDDVPATDAGGYAGLEDEVDFHTWSLVKGAAISTLLGVGANLGFSGESDLVRALRDASQQNAAHAGDRLTSRTLQLAPTITIRPGTPVRLVVHRDLVLAPPAE